MADRAAPFPVDMFKQIGIDCNPAKQRDLHRGHFRRRVVRHGNHGLEHRRDTECISDLFALDEIDDGLRIEIRDDKIRTVERQRDQKNAVEPDCMA